MSKWIKCVTSNNGRTYCWSKEKHTFVEVKEEVVSLDALPNDVIVALMESEDSK